MLCLLKALYEWYVAEISSADVILAWDLEGAGRDGLVTLASVSYRRHGGGMVVPGGYHGGAMVVPRPYHGGTMWVTAPALSPESPGVGW